jgi:phosphoribosylformylglycinamidine cyclo-ligase
MSKERDREVRSYSEAGVDQSAEEKAMAKATDLVRATFGYHPGSRVLMDLGFFANIVDLGGDPCLAIATDSVGTKILVAELAQRHDTVGIDCVAMSVNDLICVGAEPVSFVDCISITDVQPGILESILEGVREGAQRAEVSVPGGEVAQVRELIRGEGEGPHYDLVGTAVGIVHRDRILTGETVSPGDAVVGVSSTGLHSNGYTLARKVLLEGAGLGLEERVPELGRSVAEELLEPTAIYVRAVKALLRSEIEVRGIANITGDGLLNLLRLQVQGIGYRLDALPEPHPVFQLIEEEGGVAPEEMYRVFNMGIGLCVVAPADAAERVVALFREMGHEAAVIGQAVEDAGQTLRLPKQGLIGELGGFRPA